MPVSEVGLAIKSFRYDVVEAAYNGEHHRALATEIRNTARRKLQMLDAATKLDMLRFPPGNRLEALRGDREGQHSIRINDQRRICFRWEGEDAHDVEIVDYH